MRKSKRSNKTVVTYQGQRVDVDSIPCPQGYTRVLSGKYPDDLYLVEIRKVAENTLYYSANLLKEPTPPTTS